MRAPLLVLAVVLAGCAAPLAPFAPNAPEPAGPPPLAFEAALQLPGDRIGAEPNMVAGPDGNLWVIAVGSVLADPAQNINEAKVNLWHSADYGATWERQRDPGPQDKNGTWCSCDTDVDLGDDGALYLTDFWVGSPVGHALQQLPDVLPPLPAGVPGQNGFTTETSTDGGATWQPGNFVTVTRPNANDRQYITAGRDPGEVYLSYARGGIALPVPTDAPDDGLHVLRSTDGGRTYAQMSQPYTNSAQAGAAIARLRVGPDGTVYFPWVEAGADFFNGTATMVMAVSHDRGLTFEPHIAGTAFDGVGGLWAMQADVGPDGLLHMVWMARDPAGGSRLYYTRSADDGASWTPARVVGWFNGTALLPWISHAGPGRALIGFYGTADAVYGLDAPNGTRWDAWALVVDGSGSSAPARVSPWPVKVGTFCPYGAACPEDRELLDYPAVTWRDGWAHMAFAVSRLDAGAGPTGQGGSAPVGGHSTNADVWVARARLP